MESIKSIRGCGASWFGSFCTGLNSLFSIHRLLYFCSVKPFEPLKLKPLWFLLVSLLILLLLFLWLPPLSYSFSGPCLSLLNSLFSFWLQVWVSVDQKHHCQENLAIIDSADFDFEELPLAVKTFIDLVQIPQDCGRLCARNGMAKCT